MAAGKRATKTAARQRRGSKTTKPAPLPQSPQPCPQQTTASATTGNTASVQVNNPSSSGGFHTAPLPTITPSPPAPRRTLTIWEANAITLVEYRQQFIKEITAAIQVELPALTGGTTWQVYAQTADDFGLLARLISAVGVEIMKDIPDRERISMLVANIGAVVERVYQRYAYGYMRVIDGDTGAYLSELIDLAKTALVSS